MTHTSRVAVYARISEDASGEGAGVERQLHDARDLAKAHGWTIVEEFHDNDISALNGAARPGYTALRAAVERGGIDQIVVWQTSRLWRNRGERARDIDSLARARVGVIAVKGPSLDLSTAYGRGMAGLLGEFDTMESEVKGERVAGAAAQRARDGRPNGRLGYGWRQDGRSIVVDEDEAHVVRSVVERLLNGESLLGVTRWINDAGIVAPQRAAWDRLPIDEQQRRLTQGRRMPPSEWGKTSVKKLALRPSNAGLLVRHRGRDDEELLPGEWLPLLPRAKWEAVAEILDEPTRRTNGAVTRPGARRHLLTWGIGECGVCGGKLRVATKGNAKWGSKAHLYVCDDNGCTGRNQQSVDDLVRGIVIERLSRPDALDWMMGDEDAAQQASARVGSLTRRLAVAADAYADDRITIDQFTLVTARLRPEIEQAEADRRRHAQGRDIDLLASVSGPRAADRWGEMNVAQRRAVLDALGMTVKVDKVTRRGPGFDPETVRIDWRTA